MTRSFSLLLALRYLKPKRTFVSVITLISVLGVSLGVAVLIVVISVMKGFELRLKDLILGFEPHIVLIDTTGSNGQMVEPPGPPILPPGDSAPVQEQRGASGAPPLQLPPEELNGKTTPAKVTDPTKAVVTAPKKESMDPSNAPLPPPEATATWRDVIKQLRLDPLVESASPYISGPVFVEFHNEPTAVQMRAVLADDSADFKKIQSLAKPGQAPITLDGDVVVMGRQLANEIGGNYGLTPGETITIYSPMDVKNLVKRVREMEKDPNQKDDTKVIKKLKELILPQDLQVESIFDNERYGSAMLLPLHIAQELYGMKDGVSGLAVSVRDPYQADKICAQLIKKGLVPRGWSATAWMDNPYNSLKLNAVSNERGMMYMVLFMVSLVAGFCVMNTMITVTVQKKREIGVITALGSRVSQIIWIFLLQGIIVGFLGTALGAGMGWTVLHFREEIRSVLAARYNLRIFPTEIYGLDHIPAKLESADLTAICAMAFLLCSIAALIPAWMAARVDPAKALRNE